MTRIFTDGAEFQDFLFFSTTVGSPVIDTAVFRSGAASYRVPSGSGAASQLQKNITALADGYGRIGFRSSNTAIAASIMRWFKGTTDLGSIRYNATGRIELYTSTGTLVATSTNSLTLDTWYNLEWRVNIHDTTGVLEVKVDGTVWVTFSGDTKPGADTTFDTLIFRAGGTGGPNNYYDDLAFNDTTGGVDDGYPGDGKGGILGPNAAGDVTQLTPSAGSNYQNVDEIPPDSDTTYNSSSTATQYDLYNLTTFTIAGNTVLRVWAECRAREETAAGDSIKVGLKTNSVEYAGSAQEVTSSYARYAGTNYATNPQTLAAWTQAEIDALQARFEVV